MPSTFTKASAPMAAPLHGSHVTVVKTARFGLGDVFNTSGAALEAVALNHPGESFDPMDASAIIVPPEAMAPDNGPEQFDSSKLGMSAVDKHGQLLDEYAVPEFKGLWQNGKSAVVLSGLLLLAHRETQEIQDISMRPMNRTESGNVSALQLL